MSSRQGPRRDVGPCRGQVRRNSSNVSGLVSRAARVLLTCAVSRAHCGSRHLSTTRSGLSLRRGPRRDVGPCRGQVRCSKSNMPGLVSREARVLLTHAASRAHCRGRSVVHGSAGRHPGQSMVGIDWLCARLRPRYRRHCVPPNLANHRSGQSAVCNCRLRARPRPHPRGQCVAPNLANHHLEQRAVGNFRSCARPGPQSQGQCAAPNLACTWLRSRPRPHSRGQCVAPNLANHHL